MILKSFEEYSKNVSGNIKITKDLGMEKSVFGDIRTRGNHNTVFSSSREEQKAVPIRSYLGG